MVDKNTNAKAAKLKKTKIAEKLAIKKKKLKTEADMKKINDQVAKNLQTIIKSCK